MNMNKVTIRDANLPPNCEDFAEDFAGMAVSSLLDFYAGYDQMELDEGSRDMTAFQTPLGLLRMATIPMGATNSVGQFVRATQRILAKHIPHDAVVYLDDVGVKGPKTKYDNEEVSPGIRKYMLEHLQSLDRVLASIELSGAKLNGGKSQFCQSGIVIVGYACDYDGRHPEAAKVAKIVDWPPCLNITEARAFIGVCVYYRPWIRDFSVIAKPIFMLFKKNQLFLWEGPQMRAMETLKTTLTTAPALRSIEYEEGRGEIICAVDASGEGWGGVLMQQERDGKRRHIIRYESGLWSEVEKGYDAGKRECRGVLKMLKKCRRYLYGVQFVLEIDVNTLIAQLNRTVSNLPEALVMC